MKILITGGAGYIGSALTKKACDKGHEVTIFDDLSNGNTLDMRAKFIRGDVNNREFANLLRFGDFDTLFHLASKKSVSESMENKAEYAKYIASAIHIRENFEGDCVFASSASVYGESKDPIQETHPLRPANFYGEVKRMNEEILPGAKLRLFNVAGVGVGDDRSTANIFPAILSGNFRIFGNDYPTMDGTCVRDYVHIDNVCKAFFLAIGKEGAYNIGSGNGVSVSEVCDLMGIPGNPTRRRSGDVPFLVADITKAKEDLGFIPTKGIIEITQDYENKR